MVARLKSVVSSQYSASPQGRFAVSSQRPHRGASQSTILLLLICTVAFALRLGLLFDNRFHPDEALFSTWALKIAQGGNIWLTGVPVDKPPLLIYLSALSFFIFGQSELAARVPNLIASVVSVPLLYQLARRAYPADEIASHAERSAAESKHARNDGLALIAALLLALSPFAILFAPTAFLDPMMVMFGLGSMVAASRGRAGWTGILLGLAFATKVQGLFFAPLLPIFWVARQPKQSSCHAQHVLLSSCHPFWRFTIGVGSIVLAVFLWDRARGGLPFWVQQTVNYGGIRLIYASELGPRLTGWLDFLPYFFGPIVGVLGLIGLPFLLYRDLTRDARTRAAWIDLWLLNYTIGFLALHWLLAFPVWDRYLLILVPIAAVLLGRSLHFVLLSHGDAALSSRPLVTGVTRLSISPSLLLAIVALVMLPFSVVAARSGYSVGGDHGANDGIEQVAAYLKSLPSGTVVYDHWLAWQLGYYLGDGFAYLAYFDTPAALAGDLRVFAGHDDRYVIFPAREPPEKVIDAAGQVGYTLTPVLETKNRFGETSFTVYRIVKRDT
jgi:4-amino-4-deoxy-L-arabinose transferase-like glycosyltransferase